MMGVATAGCGGGLLKRSCPPVRLARSAEKKNYFLADSAFTECSRLVARLLSLSRERRLQSPERELRLGHGGQKPWPFAWRGLVQGQDANKTQPRPGAPARADFCTSGTSTPAPRSGRLPARPGTSRTSRTKRDPPPQGAASSRGPRASTGAAGTNALGRCCGPIVIDWAPLFTAGGFSR